MKLRGRIRTIERKTPELRKAKICGCFENYWKSVIEGVYAAEQIADGADPAELGLDPAKVPPFPDLGAKVCGICKKPMKQNYEKLRMLDNLNYLYGDGEPGKYTQAQDLRAVLPIS